MISSAGPPARSSLNIVNPCHVDEQKRGVGIPFPACRVFVCGWAFLSARRNTACLVVSQTAWSNVALAFSLLDVASLKAASANAQLPPMRTGATRKKPVSLLVRGNVFGMLVAQFSGTH